MDRALALAPDHVPARLEQAHVLYDLARYGSADEAYTGVLKLDPRLVEAWLYRGFTRIHLDQPRKALPDLEEAVKLAPNRADIRAHRDLVQLHLDDAKRVLRDLTQSIAQ